MEKKRVVIIGTGWRSEFYQRICAALPDRFSLEGIWYHSEQGKSSAGVCGARLFDNFMEIAALKPDFAIISLRGEAMVSAMEYFTDRGIPCLAETFTLPSEAALADAYERLKNRKIQIAEQYMYQPLNAARLQLIETGVLGNVYHVRMSIPTHHHPASLVRLCLNTGNLLPEISARRFEHKALKGPGRGGDPQAEEETTLRHEMVLYDYGDRQAVNDFEDMQHRSFMRGNYFLIRGARGECANEHVTYLKNEVTPVEFELKRVMAGAGVDLQGLFLRGVSGGQMGWLYQNEFMPARLYDDELAVARCMRAMADYLDTGRAFYPLEEALTDMYYALLTQKALDTGERVQAQRQPWMA